MNHDRIGRPIGLTGVLLGMLVMSPSVLSGETAPAATDAPRLIGLGNPDSLHLGPHLGPHLGDEGTWCIVTGADAKAYARPHGTAGDYAILDLPVGTAILVASFEGPSARVASTQGMPGLHGLLEVDQAVELDGDTARIVAATELRAPNLRFTDGDGRPNPMRSHQTLLELDGGETLAVVERYASGGREWALVDPPADVSIFVATSDVRPAAPDDLMVTDGEPAATTDRAPLAAAEPMAPDITAAASNDDHRVVFADDVEGVWKRLRTDKKSIRTSPDGQTNYAFAQLDRGGLLCVIAETPNGWCQVRLVGPDLDTVRGLVKARVGMIELDGDVATIVRGSHDIQAPSVATRGGDAAEAVDPTRSYLPFLSVGVGETLQVTGTITDDQGDVWYEVVPPLAATGWIHRGYLEPVPDEDLPVTQGTDAAGRPRFVHPGDAVAAESSDPRPEQEAADAGSAPDEDTTGLGAGPTPDTNSGTDTGAPTNPGDGIGAQESTSKPGSEPGMRGEPEVDLRDVEPTPAEPEITFESADSDDPTPTSETDPPALEKTRLDTITLAEAEAIYTTIRSSPENEAELEALELIYRSIAERDSAPSEARSRAQIRLGQIEIQRELQRRIDTLRRLESRTNIDRERIEAIREALLDRADYTAIGRLSRSRIYDGRTLPLLYRLQDPTSGRTTAYVRPDESLSIGAGIGRIVGIVGTERVDPSYRIRIITPERFEIDLTEEINAN